MKKIITFFAMILLSMNLLATNYFWVGGSGVWSDFNNHWATTSGGSTFHNQVPQSTDNVFFDVLSFNASGQTVTVDQTIVQFNDMTWIGVMHNPTLDGSTTLKIYGSLTLATGMAFNFGGIISFEATTTGKTITTAGIPINTSLTFNGIGGEWILQDELTCQYWIYLNNGSLNTNSNTVNAYAFNSYTSSNRTLTTGTSIFNLSYPSGSIWNINPTGMTLNAEASTIIGTGSSYIEFDGGGFTYNNIFLTGGGYGRINSPNSIIHDVTFASDGDIVSNCTFHDVSFSGNGTIYGGNTFNNLTFNKQGNINGSNTFNNLSLSPGYTYTLEAGQTQTISNSFTVNGNCGALISIVKSSTIGSQATISKASGAITVSFVTLKDINATGGASFTANNAIDLGNNTGWTINALPSKNLYWIGNGGNWDDGNHWSITSGGIPSGCSPTPMDNIFFDANSFSTAGQTVMINIPTAYCNNMTWSGITHNPTLDGSTTLKIYGSLTLGTGMAFNFGGIISFEATTTGKTITTAGIPINTSLTFNGIGGEWILQDELTCQYWIYLNNGSLNTNNKTVNAYAFNSYTSSNRTLTTGTSIFNLSYPSGSIWNINPTGMTLNAEASTIIGTGSSYIEFDGGGFTYNNIFLTGGGYGRINSPNSIIHDVTFASDGDIVSNCTFHDVSFSGNGTIYGGNTFNNLTFNKQGNINGSNTFNNLSLSPGYTYTLEAGQTQTVGNICAQGTGALPIRIQSSTIGTPAIISKTSGTMCWDYVRVSDITGTGGATFNAGLAPANSEDMGGNTGLLFTGGCIIGNCTPCISPDITTQPNNIIKCTGSNTFFAVAATGTGLTYQWQVSDGTGFTNLNNTAPYSGVTTDTLYITIATVALNGYQYRCVVSGSCAPIRISNEVILTVNPLPTVVVNSATICSGQTATLNASGAISYSWSTGETNNSVNVSPATTTTYTVTGTTNGCSNTAIATATVIPLPTVTVNSTTICSGQTATLTANGAVNYSWSTGATFNSISASPVTTTTYTVTGTTNGCSNTAIAIVTVTPIPTANAGQDASVVSNTPVQLGSAPITGISYSWNPTTGLSYANVSNPTLVLQNNGSTPQIFTYILTATNGTCSKTDTVLITVSPSQTPPSDQEPDLDKEMAMPNANFYDIQSRMLTYFSANPDSTEVDGLRAKFNRWEWFWQDRVDDAITKSKSGGFNAANRELAAYIQDPVCNTPSSVTSNWTGLGPFTQPNPVTDQNMGIIHSIYVDPLNNNNILAGSFTSGLFKTTNGGTTWSNPDVSRLPAMGVRSIVVDPTSNNQTIYIATGMGAMGRPGYGIGILKSTDGGAHWNQTALTITPTSSEYGDFNVYKILMNPTNSNILYAITDKKLYVTTDGFATVTEMTNIPPSGINERHFRDIKFKPGSSTILFVCGTNELLKSTNSGFNSWTDETNNLSSPTYLNRMAISITDNNLYVFYFSSGQARIDKYSFNNGIWNSVSSPNLANDNYVFVVSPVDSLVMYFGQGQLVLFKSTTGGSTLFPITYYNQPFNGTYTHADIRTVQLMHASNGGTADTLYVGNDGGILKTVNGGASWTNINGTGLNITQFYGIGGTESNPNLLVAGAQDNGLYTYNAPNWTVRVVGDAYDACIDKVDPNIMFGAISTPALNLKKSIYGGGLSWVPMNQPSGPSLANRPLFIDNNNNWYAGYHDVFKSTNQGGSWYIQQGSGGTKISDFSTFNIPVTLDDGTVYNSIPPNMGLVAIAVAPSDSNVIYAAYPGATWDANPTTGLSCGVCPEALAKKIFWTSNGGNSWTDITAGLEAVRYAGITHIAVDPNNSSRIWLSFNDIWPTSTGGGVNRVIYGHEVNGVWTWTDHSVGLPPFPVSSIVYQNGTDDGLYVGTDVGVYYTNNTIYPNQGWVCYSGNLPVVIVTDLEINYCSGKIRAATHGRGLWESPLVPAPAQIIASGTISAPVNYTSDILIPTGGDVIVTSTINMAAGRKIIVERGGKLTINGGTITNACGLMWQGIEVWGDRTKSQFPTSGVQLQGKVILKNNANIENAREGISTIKTNADGSRDMNYTGGIIQAENSNFLNCRRAITYLSYQNFIPANGNSTNNIGYFKHCNFLTTGQLNDPAMKPYAFVSLYDVQGVRFLGNVFKNSATISQNQGYKGNGITSVDANYSVNSYCITIPPLASPCPPANTVRNHFENLVYGINAAAGISPLKAVTVNNSEFINNDFGVYVKGVYNPTITSNTFDVAGTWISYGVYIDNSTKFKLEDNHFTTNHNGYIGSYVNNSVNNSQSNANTVYNNYYEKLLVGNIAANDNYDNVNYLGLKINCDDFTNGNYIDNAVLPIENPNTDIDPYQSIYTSDLKTLVRNLYSASCNGNENQYYIDKSSTTPILHFNSLETWAAPACKDALVISVPCTGIFRNRTSDCPSTFGNTHSTIKSDIALINAQVSQLKTTLDAGAATSLITFINSAMPAGALKNVLMAKSPYLSDQVSIAYIKKANTPPPGNLKDVLIANSPVTTPVIDALNTISLPSGIRNQIITAQTGISERAKLEGQIASLNSDKDMLISDNISLFLNDTLVSNPMDSVIKILKVENRINTKVVLIDAYIEQNDFANAQQEINTLRATGNVDDLCDFKELVLSLQQSIEGAYRMKTDNALKTQIENLANNPANGSSKFAQALLQKVFESGFQEEVLLPVSSGTRAMEILDTIAQSKSQLTKVYPNPAQNSIKFEVNFETEDVINSYLIIIDVVGRQMGQYNITANKTPVIVNTETYSNGIYFYSVYNNSVLRETAKFIISK